MRKIFLIILLFIALFLSYRAGIQHVIHDSEIFITEIDESGIVPVYIELDGNVYEHILYIC